MVPEPINFKKPEQSTTTTEGEDQKQLDRQVREMMSTLTHRLTELHQVNKSGSRIHGGDDEDDHGLKIITLAGSNTGATMRSELDDISDLDVKPFGDQETLTAYTNSNFQAINNSIMFGGSYSSKDPGVHIDISDLVGHYEHKAEKHEKKGKKKGKAHDKNSEDED